MILDDGGFSSWLEDGAIASMPGFDEKVQLFPVSPKVNSPHYDAEDCIAPLVGEAS